MEIIQACINMLKTEFEIFGVTLTFLDIAIWSIIMTALLKLFYKLFD